MCLFVCLSILYAFGPGRSRCNQTLHGILFRLGEGRGLLFYPKYWSPGYLITQLLERYSEWPIEKVRAYDCFFNNSRTKGDKDMRFSPLDTRDCLFADQANLIYKEESLLAYLFLYAFGPCKSQRDQIFHDLLFHRREGWGVFLFRKESVFRTKMVLCLSNPSWCIIH
jgi:hypothetical protein